MLSQAASATCIALYPWLASWQTERLNQEEQGFPPWVPQKVDVFALLSENEVVTARDLGGHPSFGKKQKALDDKVYSCQVEVSKGR